MDIHIRLQKLLKEQGWTRYRLAKESGGKSNCYVKMNGFLVNT